MELDIVFSLLITILIIIIIFNYVSITISDYDDREITKKCGLKKKLFNTEWITNSEPTTANNIVNQRKTLTISPLDDYNRQFYLSY